MSLVQRLVMEALEEEVVSRLLSNRDRDENVVYVTELVGCTMKPRLRRIAPLLGALVSHEPQVLIGTLLHHGVESITLRHSMGSDVKVETEVEVETQVNGVTVRGRVDVMVKRGDEVIEIDEIKFSRRAPSNPYEHHVMQLQVYAEMLQCSERCRLFLVYFTPDAIVSFEVKPRPILEQLVNDYLENRFAPRWRWECDYCPFRSICPHARRGESGK